MIADSPNAPTSFPIRELIDARRIAGDSGSPFVDIIAPLAGLFIFRWAAFMEAEMEAVASFDEIGFSALLPEGLRQPAWQSPRELATHLVEALGTLSGRQDIASLRYVKAVAPIIRKCAKQSSSLLHTLVTWVSGFRFETAAGRDVAGRAFDELLETEIQIQGRHGGEFTTPQRVIETMVRLVDPKPGDRVYDPCFGVGGLLVQASRRLKATFTTAAPRRWMKSAQMESSVSRSTRPHLPSALLVFSSLESISPGLSSEMPWDAPFRAIALPRDLTASSQLHLGAVAHQTQKRANTRYRRAASKTFSFSTSWPTFAPPAER